MIGIYTNGELSKVSENVRNVREIFDSVKESNEFYLRANQLKSLPDTFRERGSFPSLRALDLFSNSLNNLPNISEK